MRLVLNNNNNQSSQMVFLLFLPSTETNTYFWHICWCAADSTNTTSFQQASILADGRSCSAHLCTVAHINHQNVERDFLDTAKQ
jgi:hypothetical protein